MQTNFITTIHAETMKVRLLFLPDAENKITNKFSKGSVIQSLIDFYKNNAKEA